GGHAFVVPVACSGSGGGRRSVLFAECEDCAQTGARPRSGAGGDCQCRRDAGRIFAAFRQSERGGLRTRGKEPGSTNGADVDGANGGVGRRGGRVGGGHLSRDHVQGVGVSLFNERTAPSRGSSGMRLAILLLAAVSAWAADPRLTFSKSFPGSTPAFFSITVERSGAASYNESEDPDNAEKMQIEDKVLDAMFGLAEK